MNKRTEGTRFERVAEEYLKEQGYRILMRNFRCRQAEIDLVAREGKYLVFVEVKLRRDDGHGEAKEFVTAQKQQRVMAAAQMWLSQHETALQPRFDVIEVYAPRGEDGPVRINHIENAFM